MVKYLLTSILEANKLTRSDFFDWLKNLKIILQSEKRSYALDVPLPVGPSIDETEEELVEYQQQVDDNLQTRCYMMASMLNELQRQHEVHAHTHDIYVHLQGLYGEHTRQANILGRRDIRSSKELFKTHMMECS
ncbi:hypothetical protein Pfo_005352 [Paulownia fortunei]|nr:hypothetical protein Pfo_005352 [Paulownia fortunei]